ncbi:chaplin family protein [Streptomyces lavendofoliae]|uniref:chaplin family protein n=1 Tax=Streptomyces lavendofoliae TaxID=67314 RepID=UPI003D8F298B
MPEVGFGKAFAIFVVLIGSALVPATTSVADTRADGVMESSSGILSGGGSQVLPTLPTNLCALVESAGALNSASNNHCLNQGDGTGSSARQTFKGSSGVHTANGSQLPLLARTNGCAIMGGTLVDSVSNNTCANTSRGGGNATTKLSSSGNAGLYTDNHSQSPVQLDNSLCGITRPIVGVVVPAYGNGCENS